MRNQTVFHLRIDSIDYTYNEKTRKTKCVIRWINPITNNIQKSVGVAKRNTKDLDFETLGNRIAESRAKIRMWYDYKASIKLQANIISERHENYIYKEVQHLNNLIRNNNN